MTANEKILRDLARLFSCCETRLCLPSTKNEHMVNIEMVSITGVTVRIAHSLFYKSIIDRFNFVLFVQLYLVLIPFIAFIEIKQKKIIKNVYKTIASVKLPFTKYRTRTRHTPCAASIIKKRWNKTTIAVIKYYFIASAASAIRTRMRVKRCLRCAIRNYLVGKTNRAFCSISTPAITL